MVASLSCLRRGAYTLTCCSSDLKGIRGRRVSRGTSSMAGIDFAPQTRMARSRPVAPPASMRWLSHIGARIVFGVLIFAVLATSILMRPPKWLNEFDQAYYLTVAYD